MLHLLPTVPCRTLASIRILVVEDHDELRSIMKHGLASRGAVVESVDNVDEALREVDDFIPDVIVSDIAMPLQDGFEFIATLRNTLERRRRVKTPFVAVTGLTDATLDRRLRDAGFDATLHKPFDLQHLTTTLTRVVRSSRELSRRT